LESLSSLARSSGDPFRHSSYFKAAERRIGRQWAHYIWPRLRGVDFTLVVDVACGHGRNTAHLARRSGRVVAVDISQECVEVTRKRFANCANVEVRVSDGTTLPGVRDGEATLIYCWDAMVVCRIYPALRS
jgi:ubiquinone/menaquinone biosynthesis C-methylase UbiE